MKRTSATMPNTSAERRHRRSARSALLLGALMIFGGLMYFAGRASLEAPAIMQQELADLQWQILRQQAMVDRLQRDNHDGVNALSARLAELQAASTRLDALGERLVQMGQLTLEEFDFSEPVPVGGPEDHVATGPASEPELRLAIDRLGDKLRRQSSQLDALQYLMNNRQVENDLTPAGWPVRKGWISSRFGERNDPFTGERVQHRGLDFAGTRGTDVLSVASGVVVWSAPRASYGRTVEIDHGNGYVTRYAHNDSLSVQLGEHVTAGQVIAAMGSTGRASAPHVHFEVLRDGARINPGRFVSNLR